MKREARRASIKPSLNDYRGNWANKTEFLLSCLGYAIGIGNVWRFPFLCYRNGGGAFLVPYLLMLVLCGFPLFFMETSLGQFASTGCITIFNIAPLFKGAGYAIVIVNFICTTYYTVILAYPLAFLAYSFMDMDKNLPWATCDHEWNTEYCLELDDKEKHSKINISDISDYGRYKTPADEFFHNKLLQISGDVNEPGSIVWPLFFCNVITWIVIYLCIMKGVKSVGKVVYFTATFPFLIMFILLVRGLTLPGAWNGVFFYLYPEWKQLTNLKVWSDAAIQIFFSLGPGWGGIVNMTSYNPFKNNTKRDSILVPILNCGTSILAGFVVFSVLGFMSHETGLPVSSVATGGPGLAFITYPEAISMLPWPRLWAVLFFIMLFLLGLDSCFVQLEAIISSIIDEYPSLRKSKTLVILISCFLMFVCSIIFVTNGGMYYLQLFDWYSSSIPVILICLIEVLIIGWVYGTKKFVRDVEFMTDARVNWWWPFCWRFVTPIILAFIFGTTILFNTKLTYQGMEYPDWAIDLGWGSCLLSMLYIPVYMGYRLLYKTEGDLIDRIKFSCKPTKLWGPAEHKYRNEWLYLYYQKYINKSVSNDDLHQQFIELSADVLPK